MEIQKINIEPLLGWIIIVIASFAIPFMATCGYLAAFRLFEFLGI